MRSGYEIGALQTCGASEVDVARAGVAARRRRWLGVVAVALVSLVAGEAAAVHETETTTFDVAAFVRSDDPIPPISGGEPVTLPDPWSLRHRDVTGFAWYVVEWPLREAPTELHAIFLSAVTLPAQVFVNGVSVGLTGPLNGRSPRAWEQSQIFEVPPNLLRAGNNRIAVRVHAPRAGDGGLGPIVAGAYGAAVRLQMQALAAHTIGPAIVSLVMVIVGVAVVGLWLRRRDPSYMLFGSAAIIWGLHTASTLVPEPLLPQPHWAIAWHAVYMLFVVLLCLFCVRFVDVRWTAYRRFAAAFAIAVTPILYAAQAFGVLGAATTYVRLMGILLVACALTAVARYALRLRNVESLLLLATGATATAFGIHDWMLDRDPFAIRPVWLVPYSALAFLVLVGWILIDRFVRALMEFEHLNSELERRIAAKSASLEFQLMQTQRAKDAAEAANRAKSHFLAAASHDLRQPLHALGLSTSALWPHTAAGEGKLLLDRIATSVGSLDALLTGLLDISKLDAGAVVAEPRDMRLDDMFERLANDFLPEALQKGLRLAVVPSRVVVHSDPALLERIVRNLVANALRYTERGGVVVGVRRRADRIAIEVRDTGSGIDVAERERIFEEFYQIGNPERDRARGLGLGLAIVRGLSNLLGHEVELDSQVGRGSVFRVLIPRGNPEALSSTVSAVPATGLLAGSRVVVIDDDASVAQSTCAVLSSWGCRVTAAGSAEQALALLGGAVPDALLVDFRLRGGEDGLAAIQRLRNASGRAVPAALVSGESSPTELARIAASGFPLLHKPVPPARLRAALAFLLAKGGELPGAAASAPAARGP